MVKEHVTTLNTTINLNIGQKISNPNISYGTSPLCSNVSKTDIPTNKIKDQFPSYLNLGKYTTTVSSMINANFSVLGIAQISGLTTPGIGNVYVINYEVPAFAACPATVVSTLLTVTSVPTSPDINKSYSSLYCSSQGIVIPNLTNAKTNDLFGFWKLEALDSLANLVSADDYNIFINTTSGVLTLTGNTRTNEYYITYTKPAREGCLFDVSKSKLINVTQLDQPIAFSYGDRSYCANNIIPAPSITVPSTNLNTGRFVSYEPDLFINDGVSGTLKPYSNTVSGIKTINYVISATGICKNNPAIISMATVTISSQPSPVFSYGSFGVCNKGITVLQPLKLVDVDTSQTTQGHFYEKNNAIEINS